MDKKIDRLYLMVRCITPQLVKKFQIKCSSDELADEIIDEFHNIGIFDINEIQIKDVCKNVTRRMKRRR